MALIHRSAACSVARTCGWREIWWDAGGGGGRRSEACARAVGDRGAAPPGGAAEAQRSANVGRQPDDMPSRWDSRPRLSGSESISSRRARERAPSPGRGARRAGAVSAAAVRGDGRGWGRGDPVERSAPEGQGDYSTNAAMLLAPGVESLARRAERIGDRDRGAARGRHRAHRGRGASGSNRSCRRLATGVMQ